MDKPTVLIIAKATPSSGGTYNYTRSIIQQFSQSEALSVEVVSIDGAIGGDSVVCTRYSFFKILSYILYRRRYSAVFCPTYFLPLLFFRGPKFVTIHDFQERYLASNFSTVQHLWRRLTHLVTELAAPTYICESEYVKRDIIKFVGVPSCRISILKAPALIGDFNENLIIPGGVAKDIDIFYPAKFWKHKNHIVILKAMALLKSKNIIVNATFTGGPIEGNAAMRSLVAKYELADQVNILGPVSFEEIIRLYGRAKVLVIPSYFESISIPIYEAFSAEVAVIASSLPGIREQCGSAACYFDCDDEIKLAENIALLLNDKEEYALKVESGRRVLKNLLAENYADRFRDIILRHCSYRN
jgi:glycosyltransferase involved in cell wall biosynthesis